MRQILFHLSLLLCVCPVIGQTPSSYTYQILYTGRTLGYARVPDEQTLPAANVDRDHASLVAKDFLHQFDLVAARPPKDDPNNVMPQFRIAMGDNFSPDLYGRSLKVDKSLTVHSCDGVPNGTYSADIHLPKDYFTFSGGNWYIWCNGTPIIHENFADNVAEYLIMARYNAVIPGKHDFYFGPQYLQQIADYLGKYGVHMLGENIIVNTSVAPGPMNSHPRIPERLSDSCHQDTGKDHDCYHTDFRTASLDLPDNVLPWKRQFVLHGARAAQVATIGGLFSQDQLKNFKDSAVRYVPVFKSVKICAEPGPSTSGDPSEVLKTGRECFDLVASDSDRACAAKAIPGHLQSPCAALYAGTDGAYDEKKQTASTDITYFFKDPKAHLKAGLNHMFCVQPADDSPIFDDKKTPICQSFAVQKPMFWSDPEQKIAPYGMARWGEVSNVVCPYELLTRGKQTIAIFGVVDPDLLSNVGMLNTSWLNKNSRWDTSAQITAPDYALLQTLDLCYTDDNCRKAPKVLMAQMSYARATQLIANSNFNGVFDVVLTQASKEHDTGIIYNHYQGTTPRFALTPPEPLSPDSVSGPMTEDATQPRFDPMSMLVFTPQVYVATIERRDPPNAPAKPEEDTRPIAEKQTCHVKPPSPTPPPPVTTLPSPLRPHDFGPCWSVLNTSARSDASIVANQAPYPPLDFKKLQARPKPVCGKGQKCYTLEGIAKTYLKNKKIDKSAQAYPLTNPAASDPVTQAVLFTMRESLRADAAIVQTRDLYDVDNLSRESFELRQLQDQVNRVVWKGDEAIVLHVTGATIRKLLKQSATFAQLDKNSLNTEIEIGRDLITLGIYPDPKDSDTLYINGAVMNDTTLYAVAATDFISAGDTGYSNLAPPDVLPSYRVRDFANPGIRVIAGMVCKEIAPPGAANVCADMRLGPKYFDDSDQTPSDATVGFSTSQHWRSFARNFIMPRRPYPYSEEAVQQRPFLSLKLENLDFSESGVFINHYANTTQNLAGISNPLIANKGSQNIGADHKLRLIYDFQAGTGYMLSDSSFLYNAVPGTPPALTYNILGSEGGGTIRLPVKRNREGLANGTPRMVERPSWLSFQYAVRYERQLVTPVPTPVVLMPPAPMPGQPPLPSPAVSEVLLQPPKISTLYGRTGLRAESGDTYFEIGVEEIDSRDVPVQYTLKPSSGPPYYCIPQASVSLGCGTDKSLTSTANTTPIGMLALPGTGTLNATSTTASYRTPGAYLNFYWKFPIWSRRDANRTDQSFYFTLTNKGDLYFNTSSDTAVQTRYLDKLTPALNFPLWSGLSLTPKVDFILYENKVNRYHYRTVQPAVSLSYTFNWREGMTWIRALKYGAQTTVPSPAGTTH